MEKGWPSWAKHVLRSGSVPLIQFKVTDLKKLKNNSNSNTLGLGNSGMFSPLCQYKCFLKNTNTNISSAKNELYMYTSHIIQNKCQKIKQTKNNQATKKTIEKLVSHLSLLTAMGSTTVP